MINHPTHHSGQEDRVFAVTSSVPAGSIGGPLGTQSLREIVTDAPFVVTAVSSVETKP